MGDSKGSLPKEHFVQVRISRSLKKRMLNLAAAYDKTISDIIRGALNLGVPVLEGLKSTEREFVRIYLKELKADIAATKPNDSESGS